ncbi:MAG: hypothetical protein GY803_16940 [Chloroflexi bacterium]|nr:hypothetical protein [Chloroflexota bacterium]
MEAIIRKARSEDYEVLCKRFDEIDALHRVNLPDIFQKPNGAVREQDYYLGLLADENVGFFVAGANEEFIGFVHADKWALAKGATTIELNVHEFNASAIRFYQNLGYETISRKMRREINNG